MNIVQVAVSSATYAIDKPYDYALPAHLAAQAQVGMRVLVPFGRGNRDSEGLILSCKESEPQRKLKAVIRLLDEEAVLDAAGIRLALWMRERYFCTMYEAVHTILPAGLWFRTRVTYRLAEGVTVEQAYEAAQQIWEQGGRSVVDALEKKDATEESLTAAYGVSVRALLKKLTETGITERKTEALRQVQDATQRMVKLRVPAEEALSAVAGKRKSAPVQYAVIALLCRAGKASQAELSYFTGASLSTITRLENLGYVEVFEEEKLRIEERSVSAPGGAIELNEEQSAAFSQLDALSHGGSTAALLHGVTGSGKTRLYIRLAQETIARGRTVIVLVPEIALTPQMMAQFTAYFGERVVMLHSALRVTERYDQWKRISRGEASLVLGTRSAVFAPLKNVGLIIVDEEQELSYQSEESPRYHAREVAQYLCGVHGALLILGSATPSVVSAYAAKQGVYQYAALRHRYNQKPLPQVEFADMREEVRRGKSGIISSLLHDELACNLENGEQSILLINRRGRNKMLLCGECGYVPYCPHCSAPLTYHSDNARLMCHYCGHSEPAEEFCPQCGGYMKFVGAGTQKAEEELRILFPDTDILRMDADTVSVRGGHEKILDDFSRRNVPILLGTQMVAKGLDFANVTLVGVLEADTSLYMEHYNAAERTFHLLTQVIGRAGRGEKQGRAVIQTYTPDNEVLRCAAAQDYEKFYNGEIEVRRLRGYPPFSDIFTLVITGTDEGRVLRGGAVLRDAMRTALRQGACGDAAVRVVGPTPAPVAKVNNRYRYYLRVMAKNEKRVRDFIAFYLKAFRRDKGNRNLGIFAACNMM